MDRKMPDTSRVSTSTNTQFEIALVRIARALFEYTDSQEDPQELLKVNHIWTAFEEAVAAYNIATGGLYPDLCYNPGEWLILKVESLQAKREGLPQNLPVPLSTYRENVKQMIEELEHDLKLDGKR